MNLFIKLIPNRKDKKVGSMLKICYLNAKKVAFIYYTGISVW